jgi:hypothetical protein
MRLIDRRQFLGYGLAGSATALALPLALFPASRGRAGALSPDVAGQLRTSPFVYISPLRSDGSESKCHAELWYAWLDDAVVVTVATEGWKAQSVKRGLDRARLWVGDYGRWKGFFSNNEKFRAGASFLARGEIVKNDAAIERLLAIYEKKYPDEIADWRDDMRAGSRDGTRVVLRYTAAATATAS